MRSCSTCWLHTHTGTHTGTRRHHKNTCEQEHASTASRCVLWYEHHVCVGVTWTCDGSNGRVCTVPAVRFDSGVAGLMDFEVTGVACCVAALRAGSTRTQAHTQAHADTTKIHVNRSMPRQRHGVCCGMNTMCVWASLGHAMEATGGCVPYQLYGLIPVWLA